MSKVKNVAIKSTIYKYIRSLILTGQLKQGDRIPEAAIAAALNVSKTPVREAIRQLSWEGLIVTETNKSPSVRILDEATISDLATVRWQHVKLNIPLVTYNGSNKDFDSLEELARQCLYYNSQNDLNLRNKYDAKFHLKLYEIGKNTILYNLQQRLELLVQLWQASRITDSQMLLSGLQQHLTLVDILRKRDSENALRLLYDHFTCSYGVTIHISNDNFLPKDSEHSRPSNLF